MLNTANCNGAKTVTIIFGIITAIIVPSIFFIGSNVIANDNRNTKQHDEIKKEMIFRDEKMMESLHKFDVRQEILITTVKEAIKKDN